MQQQWIFRNHSNEQLLEELRSCGASERKSKARSLRVLEEIDRRRLFAELGYPSLYQFCVEVLHLSEHEAYLRMYAARTGRRFPLVFEMLERGEIHLTAVDKLSPHLTDDNHRELLDASIHKTKRKIEEKLAHRFPQPAVTESIRRLPTKSPRPAQPELAPASGPAPAPPPVVAAPARREAIQPLAPEQYAVRFTASARCRELLERAKQLSSSLRGESRRCEPPPGTRDLEGSRAEVASDQTFKLSTDPEFAEKVVDIVGLYLNPPENARVLSVGDRPDRSAPSFHFTPTGASWMNAVETWFSALERRAKPFIRTKIAESILGRGRAREAANP